MYMQINEPIVVNSLKEFYARYAPHIPSAIIADALTGKQTQYLPPKAGYEGEVVVKMLNSK